MGVSKSLQDLVTSPCHRAKQGRQVKGGNSPTENQGSLVTLAMLLLLSLYDQGSSMALLGYCQFLEDLENAGQKPW